MQSTNQAEAPQQNAKKPLSEKQLTAMEKRRHMREDLLTGLLHGFRSGDWLPLEKVIDDINAKHAKRQRAEDRIAAREFRRGRAVPRDVPAYALAPELNGKPLYINMKYESFAEGPVLNPGVRFARSVREAALSSQLTFQIYESKVLCNLYKLAEWVGKLEGSNDFRILRGYNFTEKKATEAFASLNIPEDLFLIRAPEVFITDCHATQDPWQFMGKYEIMQDVVRRKMELHKTEVPA
jgi:hypothetical protein